ncbi:MAG: hypothetical protein IKP71_02595 [Candidatus Riflebacteria bacterium]|nr:hypothetical protein [Candidatus Riflebacteria bacterium]
MKSSEEIKTKIDFALANKEINGFIENDCLYINSPFVFSNIFLFIVILFFVLLISISILSLYLGFDARESSWLFLFLFLIMAILMKISKNYLVYDYNLGKIYYSTKLFNKTISNSYNIDVRDIVEIGINNIYEPSRNRNDIFKRVKDDEVFELNFISYIVYLNTEGKLKNLSSAIYNKQEPKNKNLLINLSSFCKIIASSLEIPCKICENNQKLEVITNEESFRKSLNIIPIDLEKEKKDRFVLLTKLFILRFILTVFLPFHLFLISQFGFWGAFQAWPKMIHLLVTKVIPGLLGLN